MNETPDQPVSSLPAIVLTDPALEDVIHSGLSTGDIRLMPLDPATATDILTLDRLQPELLIGDLGSQTLDVLELRQCVRRSFSGRSPVWLLIAEPDDPRLPSLAGEDDVEVLARPVIPALILAAIRRILCHRDVCRRLSDADARLEDMQRITRSGTWQWSLADDSLVCSDEVFRILSVDRNYFDSTSVGYLKRVHADDRDRVASAFHAVHTVAFSLNIDHRVVLIDGSVRIVNLQGKPVPSGNGSDIKVIGVLHDITHRIRAIDALRESEDRFRGAFGDAPIGMALTGIDGGWLQVNPALCNMLGYDEAELARTSLQELAYAEDHAVDGAQRARLLAGKVDSYQVEKRYVHKAGHLVWGLLNVSLVRDTRGAPRYFISQLQDITSFRELENQFHQSQKMEAVGRLAGGIAHDFNNLLTAILGHAELLLRRMDGESEHRNQVAVIQKSAKRAATLTRQLLVFSRKQFMQPKIIDLSAVVGNMEEMLRRLIGEDIELVTVFDPSLGFIKADAGQLEQVIMNLVVNARDAMPDGGKLTVATANVDLSAADTRSAPLVPGGSYVTLIVKDTGVGINEAVRSQIFDPFFTTKEQDKGTGLGLSTVYGIVKQSDGDITVDSQPGKGTTIKVHLPQVSEEPAAADEAGRAMHREALSGSETILLVEDEPEVRELVREVLDEYGYNVVEAGNGIEALAISAGHEAPIDLILTDIVMPQMSGNDLVERLLAERSGIKVLFMSGYTGDSRIKVDELFPAAAFLTKPFSPRNLTLKIREVLDDN